MSRFVNKVCTSDSTIVEHFTYMWSVATMKTCAHCKFSGMNFTNCIPKSSGKFNVEIVDMNYVCTQVVRQGT